MLYKEYVYFQVEPSEMTLVNRITEGLDHLGVLTALDGKKGIACLRTTEDTAVCCRIYPFPYACLRMKIL